MYRCSLCGRDDTALLEAKHRTMGTVLVCPECWSKLYEANEIVSGSGGGCACG